MVPDPEHEHRIPRAVARLMARAMPQPSEVEIIRARMMARQRLAEQMGWLSDE